MYLIYDKLKRVLFWGCLSGLLAEGLALLGLASFWKIFFTVWALTAITSILVDRVKLPVTGKAVLITGCDTGFGHTTALHLDTLGFRVFAGCLQAEGQGAEELKKKGSSHLHVLQMDITNKEQIINALENVKKLLQPGESLWGIVNNAGINTLGFVEWVTLESTRKVFDVNTFGAVEVTKTFLPLIRQAKGRVVTVSSVRGRLPIPMGTTYDMTKYALEAFNDGLRNEMRPFGVKCILIEPGNFSAGTNIHTKELVNRCTENIWATMDDEVKTAYGKEYIHNVMRLQMNTITSGCSDVTEVVVSISEALTQWIPHGRYQPMCKFFYFLVTVAQHFPEWVFDRVYLFATRNGF